jgi:hypothetical protein
LGGTVALALFDAHKRVLICAGGRGANSDPVARLPDEKNESSNQSDHDKHPVLEFETQKSKMLDEKVHWSRPFLSRISASPKKIYYFYISRCLEDTEDAAISLAR